MIGTKSARRLLAIGCSVMVTVTGCAFQGVNSLPLPGAVGRGGGAAVYHVELANVGTLESNSPVLIDDVVVGSVGTMTVARLAHRRRSVARARRRRPGERRGDGRSDQPAGVDARGARSAARARRRAGGWRPAPRSALNDSSTYPSTEQTLSSLSAIVNGGGLGQVGDIVHNFNVALSGREDDVRDLLDSARHVRRNALIEQRDNIIATIDELNRFAITLGGQQDVLDACTEQDPARAGRADQGTTEAHHRAGEAGHAAATRLSGLVNDTQADLVTNLQNLEPTLKALADVGPEIDTAARVHPDLPVDPEPHRPWASAATT